MGARPTFQTTLRLRSRARLFMISCLRRPLPHAVQHPMVYEICRRPLQRAPMCGSGYTRVPAASPRKVSPRNRPRAREMWVCMLPLWARKSPPSLRTRELQAQRNKFHAQKRPRSREMRQRTPNVFSWSRPVSMRLRSQVAPPRKFNRRTQPRARVMSDPTPRTSLGLPVSCHAMARSSRAERSDKFLHLQVRAHNLPLATAVHCLPGSSNHRPCTTRRRGKTHESTAAHDEATVQPARVCNTEASPCYPAVVGEHHERSRAHEPLAHLPLVCSKPRGSVTPPLNTCSSAAARLIATDQCEPGTPCTDMARKPGKPPRTPLARPTRTSMLLRSRGGTASSSQSARTSAAPTTPSTPRTPSTPAQAQVPRLSGLLHPPRLPPLQARPRPCRHRSHRRPHRRRLRRNHRSSLRRHHRSSLRPRRRTSLRPRRRRLSPAPSPKMDPRIASSRSLPPPSAYAQARVRYYQTGAGFARATRGST